MEPMPNSDLDFSSIAEIDRLVHEPARLMVMASLYVVESADYTYLMRQADITWGNLSAHISKLEEAGYIEIEKTYRGKRPYTLLRMSPHGREVFKEYIKNMKNIMDNLEMV